MTESMITTQAAFSADTSLCAVRPDLTFHYCQFLR